MMMIGLETASKSRRDVIHAGENERMHREIDRSVLLLSGQSIARLTPSRVQSTLFNRATSSFNTERLVTVTVGSSPAAASKIHTSRGRATSADGTD